MVKKSVKICTKCKVEYPATSEFFSSRKLTRNILQSWCRKCHRMWQKEYQKEYYKVHKKQAKKYQKKHYNTVIGHLRGIYRGMNRRCNNSKCCNYKNYGGRGIKLNFTSDEFVNYVINIFQVDPRGLDIDRIDNDGHYEPGNIRFVTRSENCKNRRIRHDKARGPTKNRRT